jgi:hypothetical protein
MFNISMGVAIVTTFSMATLHHHKKSPTTMFQLECFYDTKAQKCSMCFTFDKKCAYYIGYKKYAKVW